MSRLPEASAHTPRQQGRALVWTRGGVHTRWCSCSWELGYRLQLHVTRIFSEADHTGVQWLSVQLTSWDIKRKEGKGHHLA